MTPDRTRDSRPPFALARIDGGWVEFSELVEWITTDRLTAVPERLAEVEQAVSSRGLFAVGAVAYEAAPAFDPALVVAELPAGADERAVPTEPLLAFGLFRRATLVDDPVPPFSAPDRPPLHVEELVDGDRYRDAIRRVRDHIARGDVYQVNYTFPLRVTRARASRGAGNPEPDSALGDQLLRQLCRSQGGAYACRLIGPGIDVASGSPELFFERDGDRITCRPMKGTAPRGRFNEEDAALADDLRASPKERAENLMIVDMMRNDLGRIADAGSVTVERLFEIERLPTLHQMTSTVTAQSDATLREIFAALFPCASITGAPKSSAMRIIAALERSRRGIYTGAVGVVLPTSPASLGWPASPAAEPVPRRATADPQSERPYARFGVAIRTAWRAGAAPADDPPFRYGVGSGVVWDSGADAELAETRSKALGLGLERPAFELLETMALRPVQPRGASRGIQRVRLWSQHRRRLLESADYFAFSIDMERIEGRLDALCRDAPPGPQRLRVCVAADGEMRSQLEPLPPRARRIWRVALCQRPVDMDDPFLFHKTTHRAMYSERLEAAQARLPGVDDVLLQNVHGGLTESTIANLLLPPVRPGAPWRTPPRTAGLLGGTLRAELLRRGRIIEADLGVEDLRDADRILLINSVRGVFPAHWIEAP